MYKLYFLIAILAIALVGCPKPGDQPEKINKSSNAVSDAKQVELNKLFPNPDDTDLDERQLKREANYPFVTPLPEIVAKVENTSVESRFIDTEFKAAYQIILDREGGEADPLRLMQIMNVNLLNQLKEAFYIEIAAANKKIDKHSDRVDAAGLGAVEYQIMLDKKYGSDKGAAHRETEILHDLNKSVVEIYDPFLLCYRALDGDADRTAEARAAGKDKLPDNALTDTRNVSYPNNVGTMITVYFSGKPRFGAAIEKAKALMQKYPQDYRGGYLLSCFYRFWEENPGQDKPKITDEELARIRKTGMDAAITADPTHPFLQLEMADVLVALGRNAEAEDFLQQAFLNPKSGLSVYDQLKIFYTKKNENPEKVVEIDKAMQELQARLDELKTEEAKQTNTQQSK